MLHEEGPLNRREMLTRGLTTVGAMAGVGAMAHVARERGVPPAVFGASLQRSAVAPLGWRNVKDHGAVGDGTADDTDAINAAIRAAPFGGVVYFPPGVYGIRRTMTLDKFVILAGVSSGTQYAGSEIRALRPVDPLVHIVADDVSLRDLYLRGTDSGTGIFLDGTEASVLSNNRLDNLILRSFPSAVVVDRAIEGILENVRCNPGTITVRKGSTSITLTSCYVQNQPNGPGFRVEDSRYISFLSCAADNNGTYGYEVDAAAESVAFVACGAEFTAYGHSQIAGMDVGLYNCFGYLNGPRLDGRNHTASGVQVSGQHVTIIGFRDREPSNDGSRIANVHATASAEDVVVIGGGFDRGLKDQGARTLAIGVPNVDVANAAGDIAYGGDLRTAGGFRQTIDGWLHSGPAAGQTAVELARPPRTGLAARWIAPRAGSITAVGLKASADRSRGTLNVEVYRNASPTGVRAVLDRGNPRFSVSTRNKDAIAFAPGDEIDLRLTTDRAWAPTSAQIHAVLEVET